MENAGLQSRALAEIFRFQQQLLSAEQPQDGVGDDPTAIRSTVSPTATATVTIKDGLALNVFNVDTNSNAAAAATSVVAGEVKTEIPEEKPSPLKLTGSSKRKRAAPRKLVDELPMRVLEGGGGDVATAAAGSAGLDLGGVKTEEGGDEPAETTCQQLNAVKHEVDEEEEEDGGKGVDDAAAAAAARTAAEAVDLFQRLGQMLSSGTAVQNALHAMLAGADGSNGSAAAALLPFLQGGGGGGDTTSSAGDMHNLMQAAALAAANQFGGNMLMTPNGGGGQPAALKRPGKGSDFEMYMNASASTSAAAAAALPKPAGNKSGLKRKLFDGDKEAMKAAAASITREERIDLDDLEAFAQQFKKQRIKFGFTQGDVGTALGRRYGTDFSQTTISRFEALNLSFKNMCKLRPLLKEWLSDAEAALAGGATLNDLLERGTPRQNNYPGLDPALMPVVNSGVAAAAQAVGAPLKKRRKRTNLDMTQRTALDAYFRLNSRPDHDKMNEISELLELDRDVVRVWFCNRRQKMRKVEDTGSEARVDSAMLDQLFGGGGGGSRSSQPGSAASSTSATPVPPRSDSPGGGGEQPRPVQVALGLGLAGLGGVGGLAGAAAGNILKDE